jgi:hypothetical protein
MAIKHGTWASNETPTRLALFEQSHRPSGHVQQAQGIDGSFLLARAGISINVFRNKSHNRDDRTRNRTNFRTKLKKIENENAGFMGLK